MAGLTTPGEGAMDRKESLRQDLEEAHQESWSTLAALTPAEFALKVYPESFEGWEVRHVVAHLADAERGLLAQARRVSKGEPGVPADFDRERWNRSAVRRKGNASVPDLLQEIREGHQEALAFLQALDETLLDQRGMGSMGYSLSVEGFLRRIVEHRREHVEDIGRAIRR